jgi:hypothetical protein
MLRAGPALVFTTWTTLAGAATALAADDAPVQSLLDLAVRDADAGRCADALTEVDLYLAKAAQPDARALAVLQKCPRSRQPQPTEPPPPPPSPPPPPPPPPQQHQQQHQKQAQTQTPAPPPPEPTPAARKRPRLFLIDLEVGLNVPMTSSTAHVDFLGTLELGVALSNKIGLDLVLLAESLVSRAQLFNGSTAFSTVFTENLLLGLEERRVVWRKLAVFGTAAAGITVDSFHGFVQQAALHVDVGVAWGIGPGELRLRPLDFTFLVGDGFGASWRGTVGYALRL